MVTAYWQIPKQHAQSATLHAAICGHLTQELLLGVTDPRAVTCLYRRMKEAEAKEQLLELSGPLASAKEGWIIHRVSQIAAEQVLPAHKDAHPKAAQ